MLAVHIHCVQANPIVASGLKVIDKQIHEFSIPFSIQLNRLLQGFDLEYLNFDKVFAFVKKIKVQYILVISLGEKSDFGTNIDGYEKIATKE